MAFGDTIRSLLEERDLSQKQLSLDLNIAASTLGNYIRNLREPDYATLKLFANYFDVSTDYLLNHKSKHTNDYLEDEIIRIFRTLTKDQKELYIAQGKAFVVQNNKKEKLSKSISEDKANRMG